MSLNPLNEDLDIIQNLVIPFLEDDLDIVQKLDDEPNDVGGLTAAELKAKFDEAGNIIKEFLNKTLLPQLSDTVAEAENREKAEAARILAEQGRKLAEEWRVLAEQGRVTEEEARVLAEQARKLAEEARVLAEQARAKAESERQTAESGRISAEEARVLAEQARADENTGIVAQATTKAKEAADSAAKAKKHEENATLRENNAYIHSVAAGVARDNAKDSETKAKTSENNAKAYESSAMDYAEEARRAKSQAWEYRSEALTYRNEARASEANAKTSEDNAKDSEEKAKTSETNAKTSEDEVKRLAETFDTEALDARIRLKGDNLEFDTETSLLWLTSGGERIGDGVKVSDNDVTAESINAALGYTPAKQTDIETLNNEKVDQAAIVQESGEDTTKVMSQKAVTDALKNAANRSVADGSITPEKTSFIKAEGTGETETTLVPNFTNLANPSSSDWKTDTRFSTSSGSMSAQAGAVVTNAITAKRGDVIRIKGIEGGTGATASAYFQLVGYKDTAGSNHIHRGFFFEKYVASNATGVAGIVSVEDGITTYTLFEYTNDDATAMQFPQDQQDYDSAVCVRIGGVPVTTVDDIIVTINEPITYTEVTSGGKTYTLDEKIIVPRASGLKAGVKWFALGDSITQGYASEIDEAATSGYRQFLNQNEEERWVNIVAEKNGYELTNHGVGGSGYAYSTNNARAQVANIDFSQCDFVTLAYGVNDWKGKAALGSMDDDVDTVDAFVPNMRYVIKKILTDNPYCKIFVITPLNCRSLGYYDTNWGIGYANTDNASGPGLEQIFQLEKTVCEYHGIELIDMTHNSIINRENIKTMLPDYVHPSVECHGVLARELAAKIMFR